MKRTEGETVADRLLDLGGNENGTGYLVSSVQNAVSDRLDLGNGRDDPVFLAYERVENYFQRRRMIGHIDIRLILFRIGLESERARCALDADPVAKSFCDDLFGLDVKQLIFQRRRAGVDNKNLHFFPPVFSARIRNTDRDARRIDFFSEILYNNCGHTKTNRCIAHNKCIIL